MKMKILFVGSVRFSLSCLTHLVQLNSEIVGICTSPNSRRNSDHQDLSNFCQEKNIPWIYTDDINSDETYTWIQERLPDVIFCFGWSRLLKQRILDFPRLGVIGYHPSALPENRGNNPLIWALALGLNKTASTFFVMDAGTDSGPIVSQREILITDQDDASSLYNKMTEVALQQIETFLPGLNSGTIISVEQNTGKANRWRKRGHPDGVIDWRMSATTIHNLVRGLTKPYVGAQFTAKEQEIRLWRTQLVSNSPQNIEPGKVIGFIDNQPVIKCGEGAICLISIDPQIPFREGDYL